MKGCNYMINNKSIFNSVNLDVFAASRRKCPALILIDVSQSVREYADVMATAVEEMFNSITSDEVCLETLEIGIITFNKSVEVIRQIKELSLDEDYHYNFNCVGRTNIGSAVLFAIDNLQERVDYYHTVSEDEPYVPKLIIITDAKPYPSEIIRNEEEKKLEEAYVQLQELVRKRELWVLPIGVGKKVDKDTLYKLSGGDIGRGYLTIEKNIEEIAKFFKAIGTSFSSAARSGEMLSNESFKETIDENYEYDDFEDEDQIPISDTDYYSSDDDSELFNV